MQMPDSLTDLTNCDREAIHIPGTIQSHGFLVVIDSKELICFCSENIHKLANQSAEQLLGQKLQVLENALQLEVSDGITEHIRLIRQNHDIEQLNPYELSIHNQAFNLIFSRSAGLIQLEFEPANPGNNDFLRKMTGRSVAQMLADKDLSSLIRNTAEQVRNIIGFDRVMVYRFAKDGHGEVVSESRDPEFPSWLGQHYPASDIPLQARELYKLNMTRLIADVDAVPSRILSFKGTAPLDLTYAQLRAVSPVHIEYLKNMGTATSFSISLMYKNELWGLIACHHYTPRFIDYGSRASARLIGQILSSALEYRQEEINQQVHQTFHKHLTKLSRHLQSMDSIKDALTGQKITILDVVDGGGAVLYFDGEISCIGQIPDPDQLTLLMDWARGRMKKGIFYTGHLESIYPPAKQFRATASGLLLVVISKELDEFILFFKPEMISTISWAGEPAKILEQDAGGFQRISPRNSFAAWVETIVGKSVEWTAEEIQSVTRLKHEILYALNLKANALRVLNQKLRLAYEELDTFSYTISHDLKNPIAAIKVFAQLLLREQQLSERGKKISSNIEEGANHMNRMINEVLEYSQIGSSEPVYGPVATQKIIQQVISELRYVFHGRELLITHSELPEVYGDEKMVARVFSNLIGNAVKYSQHQPVPKVHIKAGIKDGQVRFSISDNGIGIKALDLPRIFDLFKRMSNVGDIEGSGVGLAIVKRIMDKHQGKIWAESISGEGSVFHAQFRLLGFVD